MHVITSAIKSTVTFSNLSIFCLEDSVFYSFKKGWSVSFSKRKVSLFLRVLGTTFDNYHLVTINKKDFFFFLNVIFDFYSFHLDHFRSPKSLVVLKDLYDF